MAGVGGREAQEGVDNMHTADLLCSTAQINAVL